MLFGGGGAAAAAATAFVVVFVAVASLFLVVNSHRCRGHGRRRRHIHRRRRHIHRRRCRPRLALGPMQRAAGGPKERHEQSRHACSSALVELSLPDHGRRLLDQLPGEGTGFQAYGQ